MKSRNLWIGLMVLLAITLAATPAALATDLPKSVDINISTNDGGAEFSDPVHGQVHRTACRQDQRDSGLLAPRAGCALDRAAFLKSRGVWGDTLKSFLLDQAERLKRHALDLCTREGRPYEYLSHATKKEDLARKIAERDEITQGLVCVLLFRRLHAHGLISKIPRSHRWRVSLAGRRTMSTAIKLREVAYPALFAAAA